MGTPEPRTLLVVDDQMGVRRLLREVFVMHGYRVMLAANGLEAIAAVRQHPPDMVLLDLRMPALNGLETLAELKRLLPELPVVIMTAVSDADADRALEQGALCAVTKPFDVHELRNLVDSICRAAPAAAEAAASYDAGCQSQGNDGRE